MSGNVIGFATIEIIPDVSRFSAEIRSEIGRAMEVAENHVQRSGERMEDAFREVGNKAQYEGERIERAFAEAGRKSSSKMSTLMKGGLLTLGAAGTAMLGQLASSSLQAGIEMTGTFDKAKSSFTALTGSVETGVQLLDEVKQFAFKTPFDVEDLANTTRNLLAQGQAFGITRENVLDYAGAIGDAIAITGGGEQEMFRVTRALGQMGSSSKVMAQDMNQLQQSIPGIPVWQALADGLGVTQEEARKMGKDGLIPGSQAANILVDAMRKFPGAAGEMERQALTVTGVLQNFKEQAQASLVDGLRPFTDALRSTLSSPEALNGIRALGDGFGRLMAGITPLVPAISSLAGTFGTVLGSIGDTIAPIVETVGPMFVEFFNRLSGPLSSVVGTFGVLLTALVPLLEPLGALVAVGAELIASVLVALEPALEAIGEAFAEVAKALTPMIEEMGEDLGPTLTSLATVFTELVIAITPLIPPIVQLSLTSLPILLAIVQALVPVFDWLAGVIKDYVAPAIEFLADKLQTGIDSLQDWIGGVEGVKEKFGAFVDFIKGVPEKIGRALTAVKDAFVDALSAAWDWITDTGGNIIDWFTELPGKILDAITELPGQFAYAIGYALGTAWVVMTEWVPQVVAFFVELPGKIIGAVATLAGMLLSWAWGAIQSAYSSFVNGANAVISFFQGLPGKIIGAIGNLAGLLWDKGVAAIKAIWEGAESLAGWFAANWRTIPGKVTGAFVDIGNKMLSIGRDIVEGIWDGISNAKDWLIGKIKGFAGGVVQGFKDAVKIGSPSKVMADQVGAPMAQGIAVGFNAEMKKLTPAFNVASSYDFNGGGPSASGLTFNGPVSFGSDSRSAVNELDWFRRTRMGAA